MRLLVATTNPAKLARVRGLLAGQSIEILSPADIGLTPIEIDEGSDIAENAERKARAYLGLTDLPVLGMDSALVIAGEPIDHARVRRNALAGRDEREMKQQEIAEAMIAYYRKIAERAGGRASAYWDDALALVLPDGSVRRERSRRPVILTTEARGEIDPFVPLRSMYIVEATGKYVADQTAVEKLKEMRPHQEALERILELYRPLN